MQRRFGSIDAVAQYLMTLSDCDGMRLDEGDVSTLSAAASFLLDHQDREYQRWRRSGGGHRPRPTGNPPGRPPSGGGAGRY